MAAAAAAAAAAGWRAASLEMISAPADECADRQGETV
jgi:hypothetical protein